MRGWRWTALALLLAGTPVLAGSNYLYLFTESKALALAGLARQQARRLLADQDYGRAARLIGQNAISREEYETIRAAAIVAEYDLKIADLKSQQATISLGLAEALARNGQRIPLCKRKKSKDEEE